jgi:hypothetical protein
MFYNINEQIKIKTLYKGINKISNKNVEKISSLQNEDLKKDLNYNLEKFDFLNENLLHSSIVFNEINSGKDVFLILKTSNFCISKYPFLLKGNYVSKEIVNNCLKNISKVIVLKDGLIVASNFIF